MQTIGDCRNVSFPDEAIQGINFFLAKIDSFPYQECKNDMNVEKNIITRIISCGEGFLTKILGI